ncbi:class I adenylate-forming enzyme family protein [Streptomyces sp. NPDC057011]|uniref:class I adenylate-forming enzyme family protein n=1 Tax=unclassified Streptomyces TaxID=2593676 RepID=UPI00363C96F4
MAASARYVTELVGALERYGPRPALGAGPAVRDFATVLADVYRLAGALADAGLERGQGLAVVTAGNRPEALLVRLAAHVLGARLTHVVDDASVHGLDFILRDCEPGLIVHDTPLPAADGTPRLDLAALFSRAAARDPEPVTVRAREDDVARVTYTSGTTGRPKGVASTFGALAARVDGRASRSRGASDGGPEPVFLSVTSLAQRAGGRCLEQLRAGGRVEVLAPFSPRAFAAACRRLGPVSTYLMVSMVYRLLDDPATAGAIPGLSVISYGASPILPERLRQAVTRWGGRWQQGYATNEASVICRLTPADHLDAVTGRSPGLLASVGRPAPGVEVRVRDGGGRDLPAGRTGEVWTRSAATMTGYWRQPALTGEVLRDGWLRTGDVGHFDAGGYLYLDDRGADVVMVDGDNVYCLPVEAALSRHPGVAEAAVVGRYSGLTGEEVCAFLVPAPGWSPGGRLAEEACALVEETLPPLHRPTAVFWTDRVPRTPGGKPAKRLLRQRAARCGPAGGHDRPGPVS